MRTFLHIYLISAAVWGLYGAAKDSRAHFRLDDFILGLLTFTLHFFFFPLTLWIAFADSRTRNR